MITLAMIIRLVVVVVVLVLMMVVLMVGMKRQCDAIAGWQPVLVRTEEWASCAGSAFQLVPSNQP